jgi:hypothetical protein
MTLPQRADDDIGTAGSACGCRAGHQPARAPPGFASDGFNVWHCTWCHRVVRFYETRGPEWELAALLAHRDFNWVLEIRNWN